MNYSIATYADRQLVARLIEEGMLTPLEVRSLVHDLLARVDREEKRHPGHFSARGEER